MARQETIHCHQCHKTKSAIVGGGRPAPMICGECEAQNESVAKAAHFAELDQLTIHERLRRIEEWIYEYKPSYVPPPSF